MDRRQHDLCRENSASNDTMDLESRAIALCRVYGAGSVEYENFLEEVNSTLLGAMLDLPKFVPGDIKNSGAAASKQKKKKKHSHRKSHSTASQITENGKLLQKRESPFAALSEVEETLSLRQMTQQKALESVQEEEEKRSTAPEVVDPLSWTAATERKGRTVQKSKTTLVERTGKTLSESVRTLRRAQSTLDASEQVTMDEQVALQLQTLVREKAELIKENSRLKNENEGLKTLLEYATCEATAEDGEESDYETSNEVTRLPGIQAWHPPELQSPTSFSSYGILGSTSSNEDKEPRESSQASEDVYQLTAQLAT